MSHYTHWLHNTSDPVKGFDRLKVDPDQTSFWEGREFRTFKELSIASGASYTIKAVVPLNIILNALSVTLDAGWLRLATIAGGTPAGTFDETLPIFAANNMTAGKDRRADFPGVFVNPVVLTAGGTHTGGTELDVLRVKCAGNSQQASSVGVDSFDQRGIAPATYHFRLTNLGNDTITGVFRARFEVRP